MSIFASETTTEPIPIPFDAPHTIRVRKLTGLEFEKAQIEFAVGIATGRARTLAAQFRKVLSSTGTPDADVQQSLRDPLLGFDRMAVVRAGLVAWSYPQSIAPVASQAVVRAKDGVPAREAVAASDAVADLDDDALEFIATEILRLTKPSLFVATVEEVKDAQKNG